ncbi:oligopeptide/dipeptide ABC transporter ATP-binding protein [Prescottella subtropica]|uniref:oligopeptide/dipeptide ABC transporter ATP-binding protein n=1 Tax=Prescottella subtropica TaxID=2545757 RepID=UPI0010F5969D|nr:oligopeptide/dipeptide ABC transporter ATP-binding protein [Prescottella subtropica]
MSALLEIENLRVTFRRPGLIRRPPPFVAVDDVTLRLGAGETLGVVGESGSGKTTVARAVLRLLRPESGTVRFDGHDVTAFDKVPKWYRRRVQSIFQDPTTSLNPSWTVRDIVGEPIQVHENVSRRELLLRVGELLEHVGLDPASDQRRPADFSGGQRQRIGIARALATRPDLIVCDEPVSALDVSTQSTVVNLLNRIQRDTGVSYLFIGHDLTLMRHVSDRIAVMYRGHLVEEGPAENIYRDHTHPYTRMLLDAAPTLDPDEQKRRRYRRAESEPSSATADQSSGCAFAPRCPSAIDRCLTEAPAAQHRAGGSVRCHLTSTPSAPAPRSLTSSSHS